jgi:hypothetical protein
MGTLTRLIIRTAVRSDLNVTAATTRLTDTEIDAIANDGYKNVAVLGLCSEITKDLTLTEGVKIYQTPLTTAIPVRPLYVEHNGLGLMCIQPHAVGFTDAAGISSAVGTPRFWYHWGELLVLEPAPNGAAAPAATKVHCACYPAAAMASDGALPTSLPEEFHGCVYLYALAYCAFKLRRWEAAAAAYNRYIAVVQRAKYEYAMKFADQRGARELYDTVTWSAPQ